MHFAPIEKNLTSSPLKEEQELLDLIHRIKKYENPPFRKEDIYYLREPWNKLGGVSSGIIMAWGWYYDTVILRKASKAELELALSELEEEVL